MKVKASLHGFDLGSLASFQDDEARGFGQWSATTNIRWLSIAFGWSESNALTMSE